MRKLLLFKYFSFVNCLHELQGRPSRLHAASPHATALLRGRGRTSPFEGSSSEPPHTHCTKVVPCVPSHQCCSPVSVLASREEGGTQIAHTSAAPFQQEHPFMPILLLFKLEVAKKVRGFFQEVLKYLGNLSPYPQNIID